MTNTPSKEEVAKAQEWMLGLFNAARLRNGGSSQFLLKWSDVEDEAMLYGFPVAELLASYAAEQGRRIAHERDGLVVLLRAKCSDDEWVKLGELSKAARKYADTKSRLTSLREGLRRMMNANYGNPQNENNLPFGEESEWCLWCGNYREDGHAANCAYTEAETLLAEKKES